MTPWPRAALFTAALFFSLPAGAETAADATPQTAVFAGGCFWCVEADFDKLDGVIDTVSGYSGGTSPNPTYKQVTYGDTGHYEVVEVTYDPDIVSYRALVDYFFRHVDPTDDGGQFCDRGHSYKTAIFVKNEEERTAAEAAKAEADALLDAPVVTPILNDAPFFEAEHYHQNYYKTRPVRYKYYRWSCGRDARVAELWGTHSGS